MVFKRFLLFGVLYIMLIPLQAQLFYNNGAQVKVTPGGVLFVDGATENAYGLFSNSGQTTVVGYFKNESLATGGDTTGINTTDSGVYNIYGDWINDDVYMRDRSTVNLTGNAQKITGSQVTTYYDLALLNQGSVKTQTLDANVTDLLALNDCELATSYYKMTVLTPFVGAIERVNGFVSSLGPGRLVRAANTTETYLFPTGWDDNGDIYYRPVELTPTVADTQSFAVRMAYDNPTNEGYDVNTDAPNVTGVNTKFFHLIKQFVATDTAALSIYYDQIKDGAWGSIGRWQNVPEWEDLGNTTLTTAYPLSHRTKADWFDNGNEAHALINIKDTTELLYNFPNVFDPNSNDPLNTSFHVIDQFDKVTVEELRIYDRWGELVFDGNRDGITCPFYGEQTYCWDGKYHGQMQMMGNYVYVANVKIKSTGQMKTATGNVGLLW
jgi:gliding motility-associated-like protein